MSETEGTRADILDEVLHLGRGFSPADRPWVLETLAALGLHLSRWDASSMTVEVLVKDREGQEEPVTLRADLAGYPPLVAKASGPNRRSALAEAKRELIQQIEAEKQKRDPKSNRQLRKKST